MAPRTIAFLIPSLIVGGAQRQLIELASGLDPLQWRVSVIVFRADGQLQGDLAKRGVEVVSLNKAGRADFLGFTFRLMRDVRHAKAGCASQLPWACQCDGGNGEARPPSHLFVWGVRSSAMDFREYHRVAGILFRIECRMSRLADLIICNSQAGLEAHVEKGYPANKTVVVSNGIDTQRFTPDRSARQQLRSAWGVTEEETLIGVIGRLDPKKDHATFLRAAALLLDERPNLRFVCVGNDPRERRPRLRELAAELGLEDALIWSDARDDVAGVYNALDLLVSSSSWGEGFPNVVGEAMASGVPCVVTNVGNSARVVGDTGWVCTPRDPDALAVAISVAVASPDLLRVNGSLARDRITSMFSVAQLVGSTQIQLARLFG